MTDAGPNALTGSGALTGLTGIVTGGGSGIGQACADALIAAGASVAVFDRDAVTAGDARLAWQVDVGDDDGVRAAVAQVADRFGGIDIVVNCAGIGAQGTVADNPDAQWHQVYDVNVVGIVRVSRAALPHLRRSRAASIVNICSIAATAGLPDRVLYSASKGAVLSMTRAMAADHLREGIRVNCVNPGTADTPWVQRLLSVAQDPEAELRALNQRQPLGRLVSAQEVAAAVLYLASPQAASVTGAAIAVDGGMEGLRLRPPTDS